ncbi:SDR family NAD(P)-dependent oxidoreductase [Gordonia sp. NPDC127522]|uniref:SDR family NAD(P)-dependent oxidoreductase n=1 Tax=Gordonia sp. NPDC127522 TaxID=3345390 RepID=UPI00362BF241
MTDELAGRVAIVTGGASGLGQGIVEKFAAEGAIVTIADVDEEGGQELAAQCGDQTRFRRTDVADRADLAALVDEVVARDGRLDVMVNNAGISGTMHPSFLDDDLADFERVLAVNLLGVMAGTRLAAAKMAAAGSGSIINISSIGGIQPGGSVMSYRTSKAGVIHFTKSVAIELGQLGVRVNCIAPGSIPTPLLASSAVKMGADAETFTAMIRSMMAANRPLTQEGTPQDVAEAALYLASERARYVTATILPVDGGTVAGPPRSAPQPASDERDLVGAADD